MLEGYPQNIVLTGKFNPVTGQMEYEQTPVVVATSNPVKMLEFQVSDVQGANMFTPYPSHTTNLAASIYSPCSIVGCPNHANPINAINAALDTFGSPLVRVHLCDDHYRLFGDAVTGEHEVVAESEKPDIVVEEQA